MKLSVEHALERLDELAVRARLELELSALRLGVRVVGLVVLLLRLTAAGLLLRQLLQLLLEVVLALRLPPLPAAQQLLGLLLPVLHLLVFDLLLLADHLFLPESLERLPLDEDGVLESVDLLEAQLARVVEGEVLVGELLESRGLLRLLRLVAEKLRLELEHVGRAQVVLEVPPLRVHVEVLQVLRLPDVLLLREQLALQVLLLQSRVRGVVRLLENHVLDVLALFLRRQLLPEGLRGARDALVVLSESLLDTIEFLDQVLRVVVPVFSLAAQETARALQQLDALRLLVDQVVDQLRLVNGRERDEAVPVIPVLAVLEPLVPDLLELLRLQLLENALQLPLLLTHVPGHALEDGNLFDPLLQAFQCLSLLFLDELEQVSDVVSLDKLFVFTLIFFFYICFTRVGEI